MSKAYKCDRCGTLYEYEFYGNNALILSRGTYLSNDILDLCPKCQKELENWFKYADETDNGETPDLRDPFLWQKATEVFKPSTHCPKEED